MCCSPVSLVTKLSLVTPCPEALLRIALLVSKRIASCKKCLEFSLSGRLSFTQRQQTSCCVSVGNMGSFHADSASPFEFGSNAIGRVSSMTESTTILRTKVPIRRLQRAEKILLKLGLTPSEAVNLLLAQIELRRGLPFEITTQPKPLLLAEEQANEWTEAFGAY